MATQTEDQFAGRAWPVLGPVPSLTTPITPMAMMERALASGAGPETLAQLMALHERWEANKARVAYEAAITQARAEILPIVKAKLVDFVGNSGKRTTYKHETLDAVVEAIRPILAKHGLRHSFLTVVKDGVVVVTCRISHSDGHAEETSLPAAPDTSGNKNSIQAIGSTVTYLSRYTLKAILGLVVTEDDDGRAAGNGNETITQEQADDLARRLDAVKANMKVFCDYLGIENVPSLPAKRYEEVERLVRVKEKQAQQRVKEEIERA